MKGWEAAARPDQFATIDSGGVNVAICQDQSIGLRQASGSIRPMPVVGIDQRERLLQTIAVVRVTLARPVGPANKAALHASN